MRRHKINLVNTHSSLDSWIGGIAARLSRIPIVRTRHLSTPIRGGVNSRWLYGKLADFIVTTSSSILPIIAKQSNRPLSSMRCVATGVDESRMQTDPLEVQKFRRSFGLGSSDFLIGTACFMRSWKGIYDFLAAADLLRNERNIRWVIIGAGHQDAYRQRARELRLEGIVHFTGHLPNPVPALQAIDLFALLSTAHEGISQAILQAAFLEKPLIATPVGGLGEVCLDGQTGIIVPPFSPQKVADAVRLLAADQKLRQKWGKNGHDLVLKHFTIQHTLDAMEEIYHQLAR
jgi:glycosyltransferase involved in cell wall biosynthesis